VLNVSESVLLARWFLGGFDVVCLEKVQWYLEVLVIGLIEVCCKGAAAR
jgi:hypothetical protein